MKRYKITRDDYMWSYCDNISQDISEVGEVLKEVLYPEDYDYIDENTLYAGYPLIVFWFEIEEEFRGKRLGHLLFNVALQSSGCEGHSIFFLPSPNPGHAGFDFLT